MQEIKLGNNNYSVFLAGPCPRNGEHDWRDDAIEMFKQEGFTGTIYNPTNPNYSKLGPDAYNIQCNWEVEHLGKADTILFWVPRSEEHPAFTTNIEFGYWLAKRPDHVIYGRPDGAKETKYMDWLYNRTLSLPEGTASDKEVQFNDLRELVHHVTVTSETSLAIKDNFTEAVKRATKFVYDATKKYKPPVSFMSNAFNLSISKEACRKLQNKINKELLLTYSKALELACSDILSENSIEEKMMYYINEAAELVSKE